MDRRNFNPQVGDLVRFRDWDDMASEFGISSGDIDCTFTFAAEMRFLCGREFVIESIDDGHYYGHDSGYHVSKDMIEMAVEEEIDTSEIESFLATIPVR